MSKTDSTRPLDVQETDSRVLQINIDKNFPVPVMSGLAGLKRHGKPIRSHNSRTRRQRDRLVTHNAKYYLDKLDNAVQPKRIFADRHSIRSF